MTAALELAGVSPELLEAIVAQVTAKLTLVKPLPPLPNIDEDAARGLSMLLKSVRRRACERRQADAARGDRIGDRIDGLSTIPASVRRREWKRRQAAGGSGPIRSPPHVVQGEARDQKHAEVRGTSEATGPLAGMVAGILGRTYGSTNLRLRKAYQAIRVGVGIGSKGQIQLGEMWAKTSSEKTDARLLVEEFTIPQIKEVAVSVGATWKPDAKSPRVTVGLVLSRLVALRDGSGPAKRRATKAPAAGLVPRKGPNRDYPVPETAAAPPVVMTKPAAEIPTKPTTSSPPPPIGPRDLRGTPPKEVRGKVAEILEQLEHRRGGGP